MPSITLETPTSAIDRTSVASQEEYLDIPLSFPFPLERKSGRVNYDQIRQHLISNGTLYYRGILISQNFFFRIYKPNYFSRNNPSSRLSCLIIPVEGGKYNSSQRLLAFRFSFLSFFLRVLVTNEIGYFNYANYENSWNYPSFPIYRIREKQS